MIQPEVGTVVWWYPDGDPYQEPHAAIVTKVGGDSVNVNILDCASYNFMIRDGVRHLSDPRSRNPDTRDGGAWDHHPSTVKVQTLQKQIEELRQLLGKKAHTLTEDKK